MLFIIKSSLFVALSKIPIATSKEKLVHRGRQSGAYQTVCCVIWTDLNHLSKDLLIVNQNYYWYSFLYLLIENSNVIYVQIFDVTDEHTDESPSKSESKIPRFDPNSKKQIPKSKDDASGSSLMQSPSKIPKMVAGKGLQKHELMKEELEQNHGILQSRTSQLLGSSVSEAKAGDLRVDTMEMDTQESGLRMVKEKGNHEQKNDESETDSDVSCF